MTWFWRSAGVCVVSAGMTCSGMGQQATQETQTLRVTARLVVLGRDSDGCEGELRPGVGQVAVHDC
jgi:hypothetical protein